MREVIFRKRALKELQEWNKFDLNIFSRIVNLIDNIQIAPLSGLGKPEPLKHNFQGIGLEELLKNIDWFTKSQMNQ
jgi:toxin YoeB